MSLNPDSGVSASRRILFSENQDLDEVLGRNLRLLAKALIELALQVVQEEKTLGEERKQAA